jgi:hypothetical protein
MLNICLINHNHQRIIWIISEVTSQRSEYWSSKKTNMKPIRQRSLQCSYTLVVSQCVVNTVCFSVRSHHWRRDGSDVGFPYISQNVTVAAPVSASRLGGIQQRALVLVVAALVARCTTIRLSLLQGAGSVIPGASLSIRGSSTVDDFPESLPEMIR